MQDIRVNSGGLRNHAKRLSNQSENLESEANKLLNLVETINNMWKGQDSIKYINAMRDSYIKGLNELSGVIEKNANFLRWAANKYDQIENR